MNEEIAVKREHDIQSVLERVLAQGEAYQVGWCCETLGADRNRTSDAQLDVQPLPLLHTQATREAEREVEAANAPQAMDSAEPTATDTQDVQQPTATGYVANVEHMLQWLTRC